MYSLLSRIVLLRALFECQISYKSKKCPSRLLYYLLPIHLFIKSTARESTITKPIHQLVAPRPYLLLHITISPIKSSVIQNVSLDPLHHHATLLRR